MCACPRYARFQFPSEVYGLCECVYDCVWLCVYGCMFAYPAIGGMHVMGVALKVASFSIPLRRSICGYVARAYSAIHRAWRARIFCVLCYDIPIPHPRKHDLPRIRERLEIAHAAVQYCAVERMLCAVVQFMAGNAKLKCSGTACENVLNYYICTFCVRVPHRTKQIRHTHIDTAYTHHHRIYMEYDLDVLNNS